MIDFLNIALEINQRIQPKSPRKLYYVTENERINIYTLKKHYVYIRGCPSMMSRFFKRRNIQIFDNFHRGNCGLEKVIFYVTTYLDKPLIRLLIININ